MIRFWWLKKRKKIHNFTLIAPGEWTHARHATACRVGMVHFDSSGRLQHLAATNGSRSQTSKTMQA